MKILGRDTPIDLETFKRSFDSVKIDFMGVDGSGRGYRPRYSREDDFHALRKEVIQALQSGEASTQARLSRNFYNSSNIYKRLLLHYATLLRYTGLLTPNADSPRKIDKNDFKGRYNRSLTFLEAVDARRYCQNFALRVLRDGKYFGIIAEIGEKGIRIQDLPFSYCRSMYSGMNGVDLIEFNLAYFLSLSEAVRPKVLKSYPRNIRQAYTAYSNGKRDKWYPIPESDGIYFSLFEGGPFFLGTVESILNYQDYKEIEREKDINEIKRILIQEVEHLNDGSFVLEPDEVNEMHQGSVAMLRDNQNLDVITSYGKVKVESTSDTNRRISDNLEKIENTIFMESGVSKQLFSTSGNLAVEASLRNDVSLMMVLGNQFSSFFTKVLNRVFGTKRISFSYEILPITEHNEEDFLKRAKELATLGYSWILPSLSIGVSQKNIVGLKYLENEILGLQDLFIPLSSSYTNPSDSEGGAPSKAADKKSDKTIQNESGGNQ